MAGDGEDFEAPGPARDDVAIADPEYSRERLAIGLTGSSTYVLQLCVMNTRKPKPERVGIRDLRQNLSVYVKRVREDGRAYEVTERGEPVARLTPLADRPTSVIEQMIAEGRIAPAIKEFESLPTPLPAVEGKTASQILIEMREEERW